MLNIAHYWRDADQNYNEISPYIDQNDHHQTTTNNIGGEEGGWVQDGVTHVRPWVIYVDTWQQPAQYCKEIVFQLKK